MNGEENQKKTQNMWLQSNNVKAVNACPIALWLQNQEELNLSKTGRD